MKYLLFTISLLMTVAFRPLAAQIDSAHTAITIILTDDPERTGEAVEWLAAKQDSSTFRFIEAAVSNKLCNYKGEPVSMEENQQGPTYYLLYPEYRTLTIPATEKEEVTPVRLSRGDRLAFNAIMPLINLSSPDATVRLAAFQQLGNSRNPQSLDLLQQYAEKETDPEVKPTAQRAIHQLLLFAGDDAHQQASLNYFAGDKSAEALALLETYTMEESITEANRTKADKIMKEIRSKQRFIDIAQNLFSGLSLGSILIMVALGLSIIYGLAGIINMSHGEFIMIGAYTTYSLQQLFIAFLPQAWLDMAFFISLPVSFLVASLFGLLIERLVIRHLYNRPLESLLATWGVSLILIQLARNIFGDLTSVKSPAILSGGMEITDGLILPYNRLFIIGLTIIIFTLVYLLFQKTRLGIKIRAVTQNRNMSACVGISTKKIDMMTFMIGSGLAGIAGCAITLIGNVVPNMGQAYIVDSFLVVVTGGVGKLAGCVASGLGIGIFSKIFEAGFEAVYGKVLILILIIVFLQYKPKGLFPDKGRVGDD
ncbi:MAG: urea ABC transporter permease subunit UrtB [Candidatus Azobacteroides sp.]|nr:urea ABC transporter permease subunit UrtB [Candidatus Azobacteroides sp.]